MQFHEIQSRTARKSQKRVGRGGKRGTYSGRGEKGQRKRSGHRIPSAERYLVMRMPKLRGIKNLPHAPAAKVIAVGELEQLFTETTINRKTLIEKHIVRSSSVPVKILSQGKITKAFHIVGIPVSKEAKTKIEKAGGSVK